MAVQIFRSQTIIFFFMSTLAIRSKRVSAFSTPPDHGRTTGLSQCSISFTDATQQRIGTRNLKHELGIGNSRLFADATSSEIASADKKDDAFETDPAKTTPEFLAGLWRLIAKGNDMVKGVSLAYFIFNFSVAVSITLSFSILRMNSLPLTGNRNCSLSGNG